MKEARAVLERLDRIDALDRTATSPQALLAEVRALLAEGEAWLRADPAASPAAESALERTGDALERRPVPRNRTGEPVRA